MQRLNSYSSSSTLKSKPTQLLRRMQQLLGDKATSTASSFLRELFLQRMPDNIWMILASTADTVTLEDLAALADKVMDDVVPPIAAISTPQVTTDVELLRAEVTRLKDVVTTLTQRRQPRRSPSPPPPLTPPCAGTTNALVRMPASADHLVPGQSLAVQALLASNQVAYFM